MYNILMRPMFRKGGSASDGTGITSGLNRVGFATNPLKNFDFDTIQKAMERRRALAEETLLPGEGERALLLAQIVGTPGSLFQKSQAAIAPTMKLLAQKREGELALASQDVKDILAQATIASKFKEDKEIADIRRMIAAGKLAEEKNKLLDNKIRIQNLLSGKLTMDERNNFTAQLKDVEDQLKVVEGKREGLIPRVLGQSPFSKGGRVGYQEGDLVEDTTMTETVEPGMEETVVTEDVMSPENVMPSEDRSSTTGMRLKDLRAKLEGIIPDDVITLIAFNQDAFVDFANIRTQNDVDDFNAAYGTNLALPVRG